MTFDINQMRTNRDAENEGVWIDYEGGLRLKIARLQNEAHEQFMLEKRRQVQTKKRVGADADISRAVIKELTIESMARHILLDWDNMVEGGKRIEYSVEEATRLLTEVPEFYRLVEEESMNIENFRAHAEETDRGNSGRSGTGTDGGDQTSPTSEPSNAGE